MALLAAPLHLSAWQNFYEIVGSSAGALVGLQFVVIALIASMRQPADGITINAFSTPTVVHFSIALIVSALMDVPWPTAGGAFAALVCCAGFGLLYMMAVFGRIRRQTLYQPVAEDWVWYTTVPAVLYALLAVAALLLLLAQQASLFATAGVIVTLLLVGIRNAWDTVTHIVTHQPAREGPGPP